MAKERSEASIWFWMLAIVVGALPCVGFLFAVIFALVGSNETRKNYFKAVLVLHVLGFVFLAVVMALGLAPAIWEVLKEMGARWPVDSPGR